MSKYNDEEKLKNTKLIRISDDAYLILKKAKKDFEIKGRKVSMAKLISNFVIDNENLLT